MKKILAAGCLTLFVGAALGEDWTGFRGPGGAAVSAEKGLPVKWSGTEGLRWKADLPGKGLSCPVISGGKVFVTACSGYREKRLLVLCFDEATGAKLWERQFAATGPTMCHPTTNMAAPTPVTDGKRVFALFATGDVAALDADGDLLWYRSLYRDYGNITNQLGLAASPVLYKNTLLLPMENTGNSFAAGLDATTGQTKWKYDRPREINWVTPALFQSGGRMSAVFATNKDVTAYDPETGTVAWTLGELKPGGAASLTAAGELLLVPGADLKALKPNSSGGTPEILWESAKVAAPYASPVLYEGRVYNVSKVAVTCVDAKTGELVWTQRIKGGSFWASPVAADGKLYAVTEDGIATVLKLGDKPEVLATNELGDKVLATPAISNGAIFLRTDSKLYCIGGKKAK